MSTRWTAYCVLAFAFAVMAASTAHCAGTDVGFGKQELVFTVLAAKTAEADKSPPSVECVVKFGPVLPISAVAFSADGKKLAVGGYKEVLLWDLVAGKLSKRIGMGHLSGRVGAVTFLEKDTKLAVGDGVPGRSGAVKIFLIAAGVPVRISNEPTDVVNCIAVSADGKFIAASGAYKEVHVWNAVDGRLVHTVKGHTDRATGVAFSPDNKLMATASLDKSMLLCKVGSWERAGRGSAPEPLRGVAFDGRSQSIVSASGGPSDRAAHVWNIRYLGRSRPIVTESGMPMAVAWSPKSSLFHVACNDGTLQGLPTWGRRLTMFRGHTDWVYAVAVTDDGKKLASAGADGTAKLWNTRGGQLVATLVQLTPGKDEWLFVTPQGYMTASSDDVVNWRNMKGVDLSGKELTAKLMDAASVGKLLAGAKVPPPVLKKPAPKPPVKKPEPAKKKPPVKKPALNKAPEK